MSKNKISLNSSVEKIIKSRKISVVSEQLKKGLILNFVKLNFKFLFFFFSNEQMLKINCF